MSHTTLDDIKVSLREIISTDLDSGIAPTDIKDEISLYEDGVGLDSIAIVNLIGVIEKRFGIQFNDTEFKPETFSSLNNLAGFINSKLS